jgi:hypothetical protein
LSAAPSGRQRALVGAGKRDEIAREGCLLLARIDGPALDRGGLAHVAVGDGVAVVVSSVAGVRGFGSHAGTLADRVGHWLTHGAEFSRIGRNKPEIG